MQRFFEVRLALPFLLIASCALPACVAQLRSDSAEQFARVFSCPRARVVVTRRSDVLPHQLLVPDALPSPEVAADPARLEFWREQRSDDRARADSRHLVLEAIGCGHRETYVCGTDPDYEDGNFGCSRYLGAQAPTVSRRSP